MDQPKGFEKERESKFGMSTSLKNIWIEHASHA
jgi:hypothetical protein